MRLISAKVSSYRIHKETEVLFDENLNLIGGPNESGKSTFVEAVHRALFLKSRVTGEAQSGMVSNTHSGHPEVEVVFESNGNRYTIRKRFSGQSGSSLLSASDGQTWNDEKAEAQLASLLQVEELGGGRGITERVRGQWGHLWVWQGQSGDDPATHTEAQNAKLIQRLQQIGGAAARLSEKDSDLAELFETQFADRFQKSGKAKKDSPLGKAETELESARTARDEKSERLASLHQAMRDERESSLRIKEGEASISKLEEELEKTRESQSQIEKLKQIVGRQQTDTKAAALALDEVKTTNRNVEESEAEIQTLNTSLAPIEKKRDSLAVKLDSAQKEERQARSSDEETTESIRLLRLQKDLLEKQIKHFECTGRCDALEADLKKALDLKASIEKEEEKLTKLPRITSSKLTKLQKNDNSLREAEAALSAIATRIELVDTSERVSIDGESLTSGDSRTIDQACELKVGDKTRLRILPGGGTSLDQSLQNVQKLKDQRLQELAELGVKSTDEAAEMLVQIQAIEQSVRTLQTRQEGLDAVAIEKNLSQSKSELAALDADIARRQEQLPDFTLPTDLVNAKRCESEASEQINILEKKERQRQKDRKALQANLDTLSKSLEKQNSLLESERTKLTSAKARLKLLLEQSGDANQRAKRLQEAERKATKAQKELNESQDSLSKLQPESIEATLKRLQRSSTNAKAQLEEAIRKQAISREKLSSEGTSDPTAELEKAQANFESAQAQHSRDEKHASAIKLLRTLFQDRQKELSDSFNKPLADKITGYMRSIFGPQARAQVSLGDDQSHRIALIRSNEENAIEFDKLSGGAKEQLAAAVRLAIAELLAAEHGSTLPIVFDDAFAYSDPERTRSLQNMLDLAARQGLQVILLSCTPGDYTSLGARTLEMYTVN